MEKQNTLFYNKIQSQFSQEAGSFIPDPVLEQTLSAEKNLFEKADFLGISAQKIIYGNSLRHCKYMLRKKQPFFALYQLLSFFMELTSLLLCWEILLNILRFFLSGNDWTSFTKPLPFLYSPVIIAGLLLYSSLHTAILRRLIQKTELPAANAGTGESIRTAFQKKWFWYQLFLLLFLVVLCISTVCIAVFLIPVKTQITLFYLFMAYVSSAVLSGIHNTLYSSHFRPFLSIGFFLLTRRPAEAVEKVTRQYIHSSTLQLLENRQKTEEGFKKDTMSASEAKTTLRSRLVTQRCYYALALFIAVILAVICIMQLRYAFSISLGIFFTILILIAIGLLIAFLSANHVIKQLSKK